MKKELKNLGQVINRKELKNDELKNSIGGKGYTCGGFNCNLACTTLSGSRRCAISGVFYQHSGKYFDAGFGCSSGSAAAQCWCLGPGGKTIDLCS